MLGVRLLVVLAYVSLLPLTASADVTPASVADRLTVEQHRVSVDGRIISAQVARVPLRIYQMKVALARGQVGATEPIAAMALRAGAHAVINGCFFNAYTPETIKAPYHHIVTGGALVHTGNTGTTLGFDRAGRYQMERVRINLLGGLDGHWRHPDNWYAYFMNHPVESTNAAVIYTPHWVAKRTPAAGLKIVVSAGVVRSVGEGGQAIPPDGYILALAGRERYLAGRLTIGRRAAYRLAIRAQDPAFWESVQEAIECGPRLLRGGEVSVDALAEGFSHPKIVALSLPRSAIGVTRDGVLLLVTTTSVGVVDLARLMRVLGAHDAMNLDGGASSGLWMEGRYVTVPGRDVSHAVVIVRRP